MSIRAFQQRLRTFENVCLARITQDDDGGSPPVFPMHGLASVSTTMAALSSSGHSLRVARKIQLPFPAPHRRRKLTCSNLSVLGKRKCVLHVDPKVVDGIIDLAIVEEDL